VTTEQRSADGTWKWLLRFADGQEVETVFIPEEDRGALCVSTQIGCTLTCKFCHTGTMPLVRNLGAPEIVAQMLVARDALAEWPTAREGGPPRLFTNVVVMGMGEPLYNYDNTVAALRLATDETGLSLSRRRITVSTSGVVPRIEQLGRDLGVGLAISLHAPNEPLRKQLIPWAEHFALDDILDAARYYFDRTGREVTLEYILLSGVNDRPEHARQLAKVCQTMRANVNLIRYNEVAGLPYVRPKSDDVMAFQNVLRANGVNAHVRKSRGRDIDAACGQLRRKQEEQDAQSRQGGQGKLVTLGLPGNAEGMTDMAAPAEAV